MKQSGSRGFTLLEMLVVIAIISILSAVVMYSITRARAAGEASKCRANLRNLGQAAMNYTLENNGQLPFAGGYEMYSRSSARYYERRGWVNWITSSSTGKRPTWPSESSHEDAMIQPPWFGAKGLRGIHQGTLWSDSSLQPLHMLDIATYCCPLYKRKARAAGDAPGRKDAVRSYAMNSYFGYQDGARWDGVSISAAGRPASRTMLFTEMRVLSGQKESDDNFDKRHGGDQALDAEGPNDSGTNDEPYESIGFYHVVAGQRCGHVVFVDGHVELARERDNNGKNPTLGLAQGSL